MTKGPAGRDLGTTFPTWTPAAKATPTELKDSQDFASVELPVAISCTSSFWLVHDGWYTPGTSHSGEGHVDQQVLQRRLSSTCLLAFHSQSVVKAGSSEVSKGLHRIGRNAVYLVFTLLLV